VLSSKATLTKLTCNTSTKRHQEVSCSSNKYQSPPNPHTSTGSYSSFRNEPHSLHRNVSNIGNQSSVPGNRSCVSGKSESNTRCLLKLVDQLSSLLTPTTSTMPATALSFRLNSDSLRTLGAYLGGCDNTVMM